MREYSLIHATDEDIKSLASFSAFTFVGTVLSEENLTNILNYLGDNIGFKYSVTEFYTFTGQQFNNLYQLTGTNAYPNDLNFLSIKLESFDESKVKELALLKLRVGARWLDDVVSNDLDREIAKK